MSAKLDLATDEVHPAKEGGALMRLIAATAIW
jgi:hypothetical protein